MDEIVLTATEMESAHPARKANAAQTEMFSIVAHGDHWHVLHDGQRSAPHASRRAAFEAAVAAALPALEAGHDVTLRTSPAAAEADPLPG